MKVNDLRTRVRFPSTLNKENLENLRALSKETRIPMSALMDQGLELLFEHYEDINHKLMKKAVKKAVKKKDKENT